MADDTLPSKNKRIYQDIEATAGPYAPWVYDLLTFQRSSWETSEDPLNEDFIPLTDVPLRSSRDAKMFVVGLIPPAANVTGNLLDRSASIQASGQVPLTDSNVDVTTGYAAAGGGAIGDAREARYNKSYGPVVTAPGYQFNPVPDRYSRLNVPATSGAVGEPGGSAVAVQHSTADLYNLMHDAYVSVFGTEPTPTQLLFLVAQSKRETGGLWPNNNAGQVKTNENDPTAWTTIQNGKTIYWKTYPSASDGARAFVQTAFKNPNARQTAADGDAMGYMTSVAQTGYYGESVDTYYRYGNFPGILRGTAADIKLAGGPDWGKIDLPPRAPAGCCFDEDVYAYQKRVNNKKDFANFRFNGNSLYNDACPLLNTPLVDPNAKPPGWKDEGADAAAEAEKAFAKASEADLNQSKLGQQLIGAQRDYIKALQIAIKQMADTPPLRMLINPISFKVAQEKVISDGNVSRTGTIVQHWGEQQVKISASGKLAAFYAMDAGTNPNGSPGNGPGLTRMARNFSASYQNFLSLYLIYRNNGTIWLEDLNRISPTSNNLALVGSVYLYYDNVLYIGSFDSFSITEADTAPFTLEYSYEFTARAVFELDSVPDPLEQYGNNGVFASRNIPTDTSVTTPAAPATPIPVPPVPPNTSIFGNLGSPVPTKPEVGIGGNPEIIPSRIGGARAVVAKPIIGKR